MNELTLQYENELKELEMIFNKTLGSHLYLFKKYLFGLIVYI